MLKTREHIALLTAMKTAGLALSLVRSFSEDQLQTCCDRLNAVEVSVGSCREYGKLQSTLVENPGSIEHIRQLLAGSELISEPKVHVQDPYSFRCVPQVHGAVKDTLRYVESVIDIEINSATDNPTVLPDEDLIVSAGNFHGEPIALPIDFLSIAMSELANISERRIYRLVSGTRGLPSFLVANPGVNSGFMITQYTAASCVSLNKSLAMPSSVDSIPSCQDQEDLVSMGANAAIKLQKVILNTERVLAIELFNAAQALDFRLPLKSSPAICQIHQDFRRVVPFILNDELMYPHIERAVQFLRQQQY